MSDAKTVFCTGALSVLGDQYFLTRQVFGQGL